MKDKPPTQKEMDEMMKEMQKAMNDMDPEDKKMLDSMGFKMPSMNNIPKVSDKQLADAWEEEARLVPRKNTARIAAIPAVPTTAALPAFMAKVHAAVVAKFTPAQKTEAEAVYTSIKQNPTIPTSSAAIGFWLQGQPLLATYLMGRACQDAPGNIDNINNYAAMLTMAGAEQAAIPILLNLNNRFPRNSTVLNNIGQAWFGLGDIDKAGKYLDSAIRIYAYHSQANYTKCLIEESKGNTTAAAEALVRSIKKSHSADKESKLRKLGRKLSDKDVDFPFKMPQDPLGLEKFSWPEYPISVRSSLRLEPEWDEFKQKCNAELRELNSKAAQLEKIAMEAMQKRTTALMQAATSGKPVDVMPFYAPVAAIKLSYLVDDRDGSAAHRMEKHAERFSEAMLNDTEQQEKRIAEEKKVSEKYDPQIGEGLLNPLEAYCADINEVRTKYLKAVNAEWQKIQSARLEDERKMLNDQVYYAQYTNWPEDFEVIKIQAKIKWLNLIKDQIVRFQQNGPFCTEAEEKETAQSKKPLQHFDDVACKYHSSIDFGIMEFNSDCSRFEGKLKLGKINYTRKIDSDDNDRLIAASLEIKVGASAGWEKGPVQAEVGAQIKGRLEWNDKGITNWQVISEVSASAGSNLGYGDKSIDIAGMEAQIGMNSGSSVTGKGLLEGVEIRK